VVANLGRLFTIPRSTCFTGLWKNEEREAAYEACKSTIR